uniref:Uncharacterized protein n=1 Tax=Arundo donax TaxID=35708 RepID=A0A0A9CML9_ARUDO
MPYTKHTQDMKQSDSPPDLLERTKARLQNCMK